MKRDSFAAIVEAPALQDQATAWSSRLVPVDLNQLATAASGLAGGVP